MPIPPQVYHEAHLSPSLLSADFARLGEQIDEVMAAGARMIHFDVMDGHFVPNITIGPVVLEWIAPIVHERGGFLSVHLMIEQPEKYVADFVKAGADAVSIHTEATSHLYRTLGEIRRLGAAAGVAINPGTGVDDIVSVKELIDYALVMTVNPGFGGQAMIASALQKVSALRALLPGSVAIEVDGGVNRDNITEVVRRGGNWVVAGSAVFGAQNVAREVVELCRLMTI